MRLLFYGLTNKDLLGGNTRHCHTTSELLVETITDDLPSHVQDAFGSGNVIQLIAKSNGYPIQVKKARICGLGSFSGPSSKW